MAEDITTTSTNGTGAKAFGMVLGIVALIAGVYAMIEPMEREIETNKERIVAVTERLATDDERERLDASNLGRYLEKFVEVETQFDALRAVGQKTEERTNARLTKIEARLIVIEKDIRQLLIFEGQLCEKVKHMGEHVTEMREHKCQ